MVNWYIKSWFRVDDRQCIIFNRRKEREKNRIAFQVGVNIDIKKSTIENQKLPGEPNVSVLDAHKKVKIPLSIEKTKSKSKDQLKNQNSI
jgi:hypothetical protein